MPQYGAEHGSALLVIVLVSVLCILLARRSQDTAAVERAARTCGWALLVVSTVWTVWALLPMSWILQESLPFHFSDASRFLAAIALITRSGWSIAILYYWGLTLNLQSILTPDLNYLYFEALEYLMYWLLHGAVLIAPIVLVWGLGYRPTWRGYAAALAATGLWAGNAYVVNVLTGANYSYVSGGPKGSSLLDVLGEWPIYLLSVAGLMIVVWGLMTWPWERRRTTNPTSRADRFGLVHRAGHHARTPADASGQLAPQR